MYYSSEKDDWKKFEKNNPLIDLNVLKNEYKSYLHFKIQL